MKKYKDDWSAHTSDDERRKIATEMASTTKQWVSSKPSGDAES
jgi:hypothetical protein